MGAQVRVGVVVKETRRKMPESSNINPYASNAASSSSGPNPYTGAATDAFSNNPYTLPPNPFVQGSTTTAMPTIKKEPEEGDDARKRSYSGAENVKAADFLSSTPG